MAPIRESIKKLLKATRIYDRLEEHFIEKLLIPFAAVGPISVREAGFLAHITRGLQSDRPIIEIGMLFGRSTWFIATNKKDNQRLIAVDNFSWNPCGISPRHHRRLTEVVLRDLLATGGVEIISMDKDEFYKAYRGARPAMVFLDADHSYVATKSDIEWALSVKADLICGHDYAEDMPGVVKAVNESGGIEQRIESLWVLRR
jgi:predicted O-methyltransferase YrrM